MEQAIEAATSETLLDVNWDINMQVTDMVQAGGLSAATSAMALLRKRVLSKNPKQVLLSLTVSLCYHPPVAPFSSPAPPSFFPCFFLCLLLTSFRVSLCRAVVTCASPLALLLLLFCLYSSMTPLCKTAAQLPAVRQRTPWPPCSKCFLHGALLRVAMRTFRSRQRRS